MNEGEKLDEKDCGCVIYATKSPKVRRVESCRLHAIASWGFGIIHWWGHEHCCDLPALQREFDRQDWSFDEVDQAVELLDERDRLYARHLAKLLREGYHE